MTIAFDLDCTLCESIRRYSVEDILKVKPIEKNVKVLRELYKRGHEIIIFTRRDACGKTARTLTRIWLYINKIPYHKIFTNKIHFDIFLDDRALSIPQPNLTADFVEKEVEKKIKYLKEHMYNPRRGK